MATSIPVGHYSQSGEQTINRMSKDDIEYTKFLKYFGRVFGRLSSQVQQKTSAGDLSPRHILGRAFMKATTRSTSA